MRKAFLVNITFLIFVFLFGVFITRSSNTSFNAYAQSCSGSGDCNGPIYCNGPCNVLWYEPCNCSCSAQLCDYYTLACGTISEPACKSAPGFGTWDQHGCGGAGQCTNYYICGGSGIKQFDCPGYINPCMNVCSTPTPTPGGGTGTPPPPTPPTSTPPTIPPPPPGPPSCEFLSGPTDVTASSITIRSYQAQAYDADNNLSQIEVWKTPTGAQSWELIGDCTAAGGVWTCWGDTTFPTPGTYYIACNAYDNSGLACSGNPWCEYDPNPPSAGATYCSGIGVSDCYPSATNVDFKLVTVGAPCSIDYADVNLTGIGDIQTVGPASYSIPAGKTVTSIVFPLADTPPDPDIADFSTTAGSVLVDVTATDIGGPSTYGAIMTLDDGSSCTDPNNFEVTVSNPPPWWQIVGGDTIAAGGGVLSVVPIAPQCSGAPGECTPVFIKDNPASHPGVPSASATTNFLPGAPSSKNWRANNSPYLSTTPYSYDFFYNKVPTGVTWNGIANLSSGGSDFPSGSGYYWFQTGAYTISSPLNIGARRVILFVNGDLNINSTVSVTKGTGAFYVIVSGDIIVDPAVGHTAVESFDEDDADIEGLFYAEGEFASGTTDTTPGDYSDDNDLQLHIRGSVSAGSFNLQRALPDNSAIPAEVFEFAPDMVVGWPPYLSEKSTSWREVSP